jgi:hypothetical protein
MRDNRPWRFANAVLKSLEAHNGIGAPSGKTDIGTRNQFRAQEDLDAHNTNLV